MSKIECSKNLTVYPNDKIPYFFEKTCPKDESKLKHGIGVKEHIYSKKAEFGQVDIFDTYAYGRILTIDGIVQTSEADECIYHETICHLPMFYHSNPKKVLIIGGGDGGALREILKHPVEKITMVEILEEVVNNCKKFMPKISDGAFDNKKSELIIGDGKEHIKNYKNYFDVIVLDLSDPEGPAEDLIKTDFYNDVKNALKKDGIVSIQSQSLTYQPKLVRFMQSNIRSVFPFVKLHGVSIPTYQGGLFGITVASQTDFTKKTFQDIQERYKQTNLELKYQSPEMHFATTVIPQYILDKIDL